MKTITLLGPLLAAALALAACGDDKDPTIHATVNPSIFPAGGSTTMTVSVQNFTLLEESGHVHELRLEHTSAVEGHYHVYVDTTDENPIVMATETSTTFKVAAAVGAHNLIVRLHDGEHKIVTPEVKTTVPITLTAP